MKKIISIIAAAIAIFSLSSCSKQSTESGLVGTKWEATATPVAGMTIKLGLDFTSDKQVTFSSSSFGSAECEYEYKDPNITIHPPVGTVVEDLAGTVKGDVMELSTGKEHYTFKKK